MTINVKSLDSILKEVELRSIWPKESQDFSKWLSEEVNLQQLSNVLDLDLKHCLLQLCINLNDQLLLIGKKVIHCLHF